MGRNADKRRARRGNGGGNPTAPPAAQPRSGQGGPPASTTEGAASAPPPSGSAPRLDPPPAWWAAHMLPPPVEIIDDDGTLSRALFEVTTLIGAALARPHGVGVQGMQKVAEAVARVIDADTVSLLRLEPGDGDLVPARLVLTASHGLDLVDVGVVSFELGDGIAGQVALTGEPVRVEDAPRDPRFSKLYGQRTEIGSLLAVPLRVDRKVLGVLTASRKEIRAFSPRDEERLVTTAAAIALDLEQARLYREAVADPQTGLMSRAALLHAMPREVEIARRYQTQLSLVLFDADGLSALNERYGRVAGDRFLRESAQRLATAVRAADLVARFGGDEIAVILPMTPPNQAKATAKRLLRVLTTPPIEPGCTWSVGVGTLQIHLDEDAAGLLKRVDRAVVMAKEQGGDTIAAAAVDRRDP